MDNQQYNPYMPSDHFNNADFIALRDSAIASSLAEIPSMRFDSAEDASVFFARELDYIKSKTYDRLYPEFNALSLFPVTNEVDPGAETTTFYGYDRIGYAKIIQNYAKDLPRADAKGVPTTSYIKSLGASYYSVQEMRASRFAGKSLDARKGASARDAIERKTNMIAWAGDEENKLVGVLSPSNSIPVYTAPMNANGTSTKWVDKSPTEILNDINAMQEYTATLTQSVEKPDTLAIPTDAFLHLANTPLLIGGNTTGSIMKWVLDNSPRIKEIVEVPELNANAGITPYPGQGVAFMYKRDPDKFSIEIPLPFYQHPIQPDGLEFVVPCEARVAGAIIYYPMSALIVLGV